MIVFLPELIPTTILPAINMNGCIANDCRSTATTSSTLLRRRVYFLCREGRGGEGRGGEGRGGREGALSPGN